MRFSSVLAVLPIIGAAFAQTTHTVAIGENGTLTFNPTSLTVANGDQVSFQFLSKNHTVTQSTFASPCTNLTNADGTPGADSGFQFVPANATSFQQWSITVSNASAPMWFYCRQIGHCTAGMVFAINPTADKTFSAFQAKAMGAAATNTTASSTAGAGAASGSAAATGSSAGTASPSPSASTTGNANGAGAIKTGSAAGLLLAGVGLVAGLVL